MAYKQKNYFEFRDSLASGEPDKVIKGLHFDQEFGAIQEAFENVTGDIDVDGIEGLSDLLDDKADQSALEKEIRDRIAGDQALQDQIDNLEPYDDSQIKEDIGNLDDALKQEIEDRKDGDADLHTRIDELVTNDLADVQSENANLDDFLIYNGSGKWVAEPFHIETELNFMGSWDFTATPPANPNKGDLYINDTDGVMHSGWGPLAGTNVLVGNMVGYSEAKARWYLLGDVASGAVVQVREGDCIVVDETQPDRPVVGLTQSCQDDIAKGVEAHGWGDHAGDVKNLQGQIDELKDIEGNDVSGLQNQITQEIQDRKDADLNLQGQITQNKTDIKDLKSDFENHDHKLNDLSDVTAISPDLDDLIVWNGSAWEANDFKFIQTALRFKGGIAPTAAAPTNPAGGDLYVFDANGTISSSWGDIAGREVQAGKFVGYAADPHDRWFLLGDMAEIGVTDVGSGIGIYVDDDKPSQPVVNIDRTEVDKWYEPKFAKNTAFNKNFGTTSGTVAEGNHTHNYAPNNHDHEGVYEPVINPKLTAFNKNFGTTGSTVAKGNHTHVLDDLSDVSASSPSPNDLLVWTGSSWSANNFDFIETELDFKGGINVAQPAPAAEKGDLYVNNTKGKAAASWTGIAGTEVNAGNFIGYANDRWYLLGEMADIGVTDVVQGLGISVDATKPSEPVVSIDRSETDKWYLTEFIEADPTVPTHVKQISQSDINRWNNPPSGGTDLPNGSTSGEVLVWNGTKWVGRDTLLLDPFPPGGATIKGLVSANGFKAASSSDLFVLLGGGGTKAVSDFAASGASYTKAESDSKYAGKGDSYTKSETKRNVVMTEAEYNGLGSKDAETIYFLT